MKKILEDIIEEYRPLKTEIFFMILFVLLFFALNGKQLAKEASAVYRSPAQGAGGTGQTAGRADIEAESESESEAESEEAVLTPAELAAAQADGTDAPDETDKTDKTDKTAGTNASGKGKDLWKRLLVSVPDDLQVPMAMPGTEEALTEYPPTLLELWTGNSGITAGRAGMAEYRSFAVLSRQLQKQISGYDGDWSVYVKNLETDESFVINDRPMKSASVMKLFVMGAVYKAIEDRKLERTEEVVSLLGRMISDSDNEATNQLLYLLGDSSYADGIAQVDEFIRNYGFSDMTVEYNGFNDSATVLDQEHSNQVAAKDCGKLLEDVYHRAWVNRSTGAEIEQMMLNQHTRYKIPAGLPEGVLCGNKTGEMDTTENDAAIVYGESCDYILVVLSSDWENKDQAISRISKLSEMVYEYLNE